ncbi:hypothetical protein [Ornithinimicrobium flavum]|uniref:hypothetical protein n=1 Tax=Ornithinimicrobium flavum TaxID=1288636 RepID=UPI00106F2941|nr:hypothetical protein [Ornithinimicrobium flavum]
MNPTPRHRTQPPFRETQPQEQPGEPPRTWLLLASRAAVVEEHTERIRQLARSGHVVRLGYAGGRLPAGLLRGSHRLGTLRRGPSRVVSAALTGPLPVARRLELAARHDRWLSEVAGAADEVVFLDVLAARQLGDRVRALAPRARQWPVRESARLLTEAAAWRTLSVGARETDTRLPGRGITLSPVVEAAGTLAGLAATTPCGRSWPGTCALSCGG